MSFPNIPRGIITNTTKAAMLRPAAATANDEVRTAAAKNVAAVKRAKPGQAKAALPQPQLASLPYVGGFNPATIEQKVVVAHEAPLIGKVAKRKPTPNKNNEPSFFLSKEDQAAVLILAELAKKYADDQQPIERLQNTQILAMAIAELFKRPISKEYNEVEYFAMMNWRNVPPPSSLLKTLGASKISQVEDDQAALRRHLYERLKNDKVCSEAQKLLRKLMAKSVS